MEQTNSKSLFQKAGFLSDVIAPEGSLLLLLSTDPLTQYSSVFFHG